MMRSYSPESRKNITNSLKNVPDFVRYYNALILSGSVVFDEKSRRFVKNIHGREEFVRLLPNFEDKKYERELSTLLENLNEPLEDLEDGKFGKLDFSAKIYRADGTCDTLLEFPELPNSRKYTMPPLKKGLEHLLEPNLASDFGLIVNFFIRDAFTKKVFPHSIKPIEESRIFGGQKYSYQWIRDYGLLLDQRLYTSDSRILLEDSDRNFKEEIDSYMLDMERTYGAKTAGIVPFFVENGNVVVDSKRKIIFTTINHHYYNEENNELKMPFINYYNQVEHCTNEDDAKRIITDYYKKIAPNYETIVLNVKPEQRVKSYHTDVFCNTIDGKLVLHKKSVSEKSFNEIKRIYGDSLIVVGDKSRHNMSINFIPLNDKTILITSDNVEDSFLQKMRNICIDVVVPSISYEMGGGGIRCLTQEEPPKQKDVSANATELIAYKDCLIVKLDKKSYIDIENIRNFWPYSHIVNKGNDFYLAIYFTNNQAQISGNKTVKINCNGFDAHLAMQALQSVIPNIDRYCKIDKDNNGKNFISAGDNGCCSMVRNLMFVRGGIGFANDNFHY